MLIRLTARFAPSLRRIRSALRLDAGPTPVLLLSIGLILMACTGGQGGADDDGSSVEIGRAWIGPEGGEVGSRDGRAWLQVPAHAVSVPTEIRLLWIGTTASTKNDAIHARWPVPDSRVLIEPDTLAFARPAALEIRWDETRLPFAMGLRFLGIDRLSPGGPDSMEVFFSGEDRPSTRVGPGFSTVGLRTLGAFIESGGSFEVAVGDPYRDPPTVEWVGGAFVRADTDPSDAMETVPRTSGFYVHGTGFGWDPTRIQVLVDGEPVSFGVHDADLLIVDPPFARALASDREVEVHVVVQRVRSNPGRVRIAADPTCSRDPDEIRPQQGVAGTRVWVYQRSSGLCGTLDTIRVDVGGRSTRLEFDEARGQATFRVPDGLAPGEVLVRFEDGLGGAMSDGLSFVVLPDGPLHAGAAAQRGELLRTLQPTYQRPDTWLAYLDVQGLSSLDPGAPFTPRRLLDVQVASRLGVSAWTPFVSECEGLPAGSCAVPVGRELVDDLQDGEEVTLTLRETRTAAAPDGSGGDLVRVAPPVPLVVRSVAPGALRVVWMGDARDPRIEGFCGGAPDDVLRVAKEDALCFALRADCPPADSTCSDEAVELVPSWSDRSRVRLGEAFRMFGERHAGWCVRFPELGRWTVTNRTADRTCTVDVVPWAPNLGGVVLDYPVDDTRDVTLVSGGARLFLPAGAFRSRPAPHEPLRVSFIASTPTAEPVSGHDPVRQVDLLANIEFSQTIERLDAPLRLDLPVDPEVPAESPPEMGLQQPTRGLLHFLDERVEWTEDGLRWEIPAGFWGTTPPAGAQALLPATLNEVLREVVIVTRREGAGELEDGDRKIIVDYITDPTSSHYATEAAAHEVLRGALDAWNWLESNGWDPPLYPVRIFLRSSVSWADLGSGEGATTPGYLGQPSVTMRSALRSDRLYPVAAHELAHVVQRRYTVPLRTVWLDEAMSEWVVWKLMGPDFPMLPLMEDECAARLVTESFPNTWFLGPFGSRCLYGTVGWLMWYSDRHGDAQVRRLYEFHRSDIQLASPPWRLFPEVASVVTIEWMLRDFGHDVWTHAAPEYRRLFLSQQLEDLGLPFAHSFESHRTLPLALVERPWLSSMRYRIYAPASVVGDPLTFGNLVLRATGLSAKHSLRVFHEGRVQAEMGDAVQEIAQLTDLDPVVLLPRLEEGTYWVIDNRWNEEGTARGHTLRFELPQITSVHPPTARDGDAMVLQVDSVGTDRGVVRVGGQIVTPTSWTETTIGFVMPSFASTTSVGIVVETVDGARTNQVFVSYVPSPG